MTLLLNTTINSFI